MRKVYTVYWARFRIFIIGNHFIDAQQGLPMFNVCLTKLPRHGNKNFLNLVQGPQMKFIMTSLFLVTFSPFANAQTYHDDNVVELLFAKGSIHAHAIWIQGPKSPEESLLRIEWKNGVNESAVEAPGKFKVSLWMPDMGHGSSPTQIQKMFDKDGRPLLGIYRISNIYFTMGGKWEVRLTLKNGDGSEETKSFAVNVQGNGHQH